MTFLHKLAKRLALIGATPALVVSFLGSCTEGTASEYLGPDPHKPSSTSTYIGLSIYPNDPQLVLGDSIKLQARGWLPSGLSTPAAVTWSGNGATVSSDGWFRATSLGVFRVRAAALAAAGLLDEVVITVSTSGGIARLDVTPNSPSLPAGTSQQFTAVALMKDGTRSTPSGVTWTAEGGQIDKNGVFKANGGQGGYKVKANVDSTVQAETTGEVAPAVLTQLILDGPRSMLEPDELIQFSVSATWSDGSHTLPELTFSATGGSITSGGLYQAGGTPGDYQVSVAGGGQADTVHMTILAGVRGLRVAPLTAVLALGATQQLQAYASRSDGSETPVPVQWTAQGGSITSSGSYTAGNVAGSYAIVGTLTTSAGQVYKDTAHFQVGSSAATLTTLAVRSDTSLRVGATAQFTVVGSWSDGSSTVPSVTWSATGGSITENGLYTAPSEPGTHKISAKDKNGTKADTAVVQVLAVQTTQVTGFTISPQTTILSVGQTRQFSATLSWSDGQVHPVDISWVSAGGTITQNGFYTAGQLAGTFLIVATCSCGVADTASVSIPAGTSAPVTLTQVVVSPSTAQVAPGGSRQFSVSGVWSDGSTAKPAVTYLAEGGTISSTGLFVAANTPGSYKVIATQSGGGPADTAMVTVGSVTAPATLTQLTLTPATVSLATGATKQFAVSGTWSDGSSVPPSATYTATGGTVTSAGLYTAGSTAGTYRVIAVQAGGTLADTGSITVTAPAVPPPPSSVVMPELPRTYLNTAYQQPSGTIRRVAAGGNLQTAINGAQCGDRILLAAGATFTGAFTLPNKSCTTWIEISTETTLPPEGSRVTPATAQNYARILTPGLNQPALIAAAGAGYYRIMGVQFGVVSTVTTLGAIVEFHANSPSSLAQLPHDIVLDRVVITGNDNLHVRRCLLLNAVRSAVVDSYLAGCHYKNADAQAVLFWDTPGPIKVANNYLEGSGENLMIGGADPSLSGVVPSDIEITRNHFFKPLAWKASGAWTVKNLLELKLGKRVLIEGNLFENNWADGQVGFAIVIKSVNQSNTAPWSETSNVMIRNNLIRNSAHGIDISAHPEPYPVIPLTRVALVNNLLYALGATASFVGQDARGIMTDGGTADMTILNNTVVGSTAHALLLHGAKAGGTLSMRNNIVQTWIKSADGAGWGRYALDGHLTAWEVLGNAFVIGFSNVISEHPLNNQYPLNMGAVGFLDLAGMDYRLSASSTLKGRGTDGRDPGADIDAVMAATSGVIVP